MCDLMEDEGVGDAQSEAWGGDHEASRFAHAEQRSVDFVLQLARQSVGVEEQAAWGADHEACGCSHDEEGADAELGCMGEELQREHAGDGESEMADA